MRVLMFGWEFPPHISGGLGTASYGLSKGLTSFNDIDLVFVIPKISGDEYKLNMKLIGASDVELSRETVRKQKEIEEKRFMEFSQYISAYTTPEQFEKIITERQERLKKEVSSTPTDKLKFTGNYGNSLYDEIYRYGVVALTIARKEAHDVIHAHDWLTYTAGIEAKKISGKPLVVHVHATEFDRSGENINDRVFEIERQGMEAADRVITVSNLTRNIVVQKYRINPSKVVTIHNAVDNINSYEIKNYSKVKMNGKIVTFLGRITMQKGPEYFIEAASMVLKKKPDVKFVMAGSGDLMVKMVKMAARLKISSNFYFTGFLRGDDVYRMFTMSDLYVMPSVSEPFGISPLEAVQCNVPVIISKQSGVSEVIRNAIKVDFWDIEAMADAIHGVLNYDALANLLRKNGMHEVDNLKWVNVAAKIKEVYYQVA